MPTIGNTKSQNPLDPEPCGAPTSSVGGRLKGEGVTAEGVDFGFLVERDSGEGVFEFIAS